MKLREVWAIRIRPRMREQLREFALFNLAIDSKLRGCDVIGLRVSEVRSSGRIGPGAIVVQNIATAKLPQPSIE